MVRERILDNQMQLGVEVLLPADQFSKQVHSLSRIVGSRERALFNVVQFVDMGEDDCQIAERGHGLSQINGFGRSYSRVWSPVPVSVIQVVSRLFIVESLDRGRADARRESVDVCG
jgi:hypothetical protein